MTLYPGLITIFKIYLHAIVPQAICIHYIRAVLQDMFLGLYYKLFVAGTLSFYMLYKAPCIPREFYE